MLEEKPVPPSAADAHPPAEIARLVEAGGVKKAGLDLVALATLGLLAGAYIAFGAMLYTLVIGDWTPLTGLGRWIGGLAFSLGLILVIVAGAELFTGNSLIVMALAAGRIGPGALLRNWGVVYAANFAGSVAAALAVWGAGSYGEATAAAAVRIAEAKVAIPFGEAIVRGILCNILVCVAVWLSFACHSVADRVLAIPFPIAAFVALGFEHSVANMFLIPAGWLHGAQVTAGGLIANLAPVTIGNVIGGGVFVAGVYWVVYLRKDSRGREGTSER